MSIKSSGRGSGQQGVCHQPNGTSLGTRLFQNGVKRTSLAGRSDGAMARAMPRGQCGSSGGRVWNSKLFTGISEQRGVRKFFEFQPVLGTTRIQARSRKGPGCKSITDEEDDLPRLLHNPHSNIERSQTGKCQQAGGSDELIAKFHL